jgi:hypothetical protein
MQFPFCDWTSLSTSAPRMMKWRCHFVSTLN